MQWENHIWCTLRDGCRYSQAIRDQMSLWRHPNRPVNVKRREYEWFELVKVISHQCVIIWWFNSTTEFVRIRLRSKSVGGISCGASPEKCQWHLQHHACKVERQRLIFDSFTIEATTTSLGRHRQLWSTSHHTTSYQQWSVLHHSNVGQNSGSGELNARI